ncbi:hydroxyacylglutathione hydrolase [Amylibacter sp.]|nr:hydroxyacylglutathione hydrolase [Amylibacter sp.]
MPLSVIIVPCLRDNYAYLIKCSQTGHTAVVDVPEADPVFNALKELNWGLDSILITHHHSDHIDGVDRLRSLTGAKVTGAKSDAHRLPKLDFSVAEEDIISVGNEKAQILDTPGHTIGHISYYFRNDNKIFTGDSLMSLGCGRLFEGSHKIMWKTLKMFLQLPPETMIFSGHEYSISNAKFALSVDPKNERLILREKEIQTLLKNELFTVPTSLELELETNPFLRASLPEFKANLNMKNNTDEEVFRELRIQKDNF